MLKSKEVYEFIVKVLIEKINLMSLKPFLGNLRTIQQKILLI